jgi:hypothetical protein
VYEPDANQETRRRRPRPPGGLDDGMTTLVLPVTGPPGQTGSPKHVVTFPSQ